MTATSTRRAVLAGAAALPALSLPATAAETDPIFAAIESHRTAEAIYAASHSDEQLNTNGRISWKLYGTLLATAPTTIAGCAALLRHVEIHEASYGRSLYEDCGEPVCSNGHQLLSRIAAILETA